MGSTVKKQHYIWREYLTRWTDTGDRYKGRLYVMRKMLRGNQERIEFRELEKIGFEKYYYDVTGFQEKDKIVLQQFLSYMQRKERFELGIDPKAFSGAAEQRDYIEKQVMCSYEDIDNKWKFLDKLSNGDFSFYKDSKRQNILDNLHKCVIDTVLYQESQYSDEEIMNMVNEFFEDGLKENDLKYEFHKFFCMQYFRSPRIHDNLASNFEELKKEKDELKDLDTNFYVNMVAMYFAERMALNITMHFSTGMLLYENKTDVPFITGDTPIVNLTGTKMDKATLFHYPISPRIAVELLVTPKYSEIAKINRNVHFELEQELVTMVKSCNQKLANNCANEIYSNDSKRLNEIEIINT